MAKVNVDGPDKDPEKKTTGSPADENLNTETAVGNNDGTSENVNDKEEPEETAAVDSEHPDKAEETGKHKGSDQSFFSKKRQKDQPKREKELETELENLKSELSDEKSRYFRLLADFDNFKKRTAKDNEKRYLDAKADTLKKILPVIDNFERALKTEVPEEAKQYTAGYEMIYGILMKILEENGVEEIKALGETFDPQLHNAVMHVEDDQLGPNVIAEVFEKGYRMGDRILRYSIVKVAN